MFTTDNGGAILADQIHVSLDNRWGIEAKVREEIGCSLHDLLRTLLRMLLAGEITVTPEDVRRHQGGAARKEEARDGEANT